MNLNLVIEHYCDLPKEMYNKDYVYALSSYVYVEGVEYKTDGTIEFDKFVYDSMREGKKVTTSQVPVADFVETFREVVKLGKPILYIGFSSGLSGTFNSGSVAAKMVMEENPGADIRCVDSLAASMGLGMLVKSAMDMIEAGKNIDEIVTFLEENKLRLNHFFTVEDLEYLYRGGRVSRGTAFIANKLNIKPVLWVSKEGTLIPLQKERGRLKSLHAIANKAVERIENPEEQTLMISNGDSLADAETLKKIVMEKLPVKDVIINSVGSGIGSHSGPGTIALFFYGKSRNEE